MTATLIRRATVDELAAHRARAIRLYSDGLDLLHEARRAHRLAAPRSGIADWPEDLSRQLKHRPDEILPALTASVDRDMWRYLIDATPLGSMMDREERDRFEESLKGTPPEATPESMLATVERLSGEADTIFRRGLANAFARFCRDYKSNDGFKIGERIVVEGGVMWDIAFGKFRLNHYREPDLNDLDRVVRVMSGEAAPSYQVGLCAALRAAFDLKGDKPITKLETDHWRAHWFKKGTLHLEIRDDEVRRHANRLIAEHYGEVLPEGHGTAKGKVDPAARADRYGAADRDFFPTPAALAASLVRRADVRPGMTALDPSAGEGAIVRALLDAGADVTAVEVDTMRLARLADVNAMATRGSLTGYGTDFLGWTARRPFDRVVMNPPFSGGQDALHILHALKFLAPGARLVAVAGAGLGFRQDSVTSTCRDAIAAWGGTIEPLPESSFAESGTNVRTVVVTVDKPGESA